MKLVSAAAKSHRETACPRPYTARGRIFGSSTRDRSRRSYLYVTAATTSDGKKSYLGDGVVTAGYGTINGRLV